MSDSISDIVNGMSWPSLVPDLLYCWDCKQSKSPDDFYESRKNKNANRGGKNERCKECCKKYRKTPDNMLRSNGLRKVARSTNKNGYRDKEKDRQLRRSYGINKEQYDSMLAAQGGRCAICPRTDPGGMGVFHVDHCHITGKVRGLLCHFCNVGLGHFNHDISRMRQAIDYLVDHLPPLRPPFDSHRTKLANKAAKLHRSFVHHHHHSTA